MKSLHATAALFASLAFGFSSGSIAETFRMESENIEMEIQVERMPIFPAALELEGIYEGSVAVVFEVDHSGELRDYLITEATRPAFARSVERVFGSWNFSPPKSNGEPASAVAKTIIYFESVGDVINLTMTGAVTQRLGFAPLYRVRKSLVSHVDDLDGRPQLLQAVDPMVSQEMIDGNKGSKGTFAFYVDQEGNVRMPTLENSEGDIDIQMLVAAQDALEQWKFTPPTVNGKPTIVRLAQPFVFNAEALASR